MAPPRKFTAKQVRDALMKVNGNQKEAAKLLGCNRLTIAEYWKRYPSLNKLVKEFKDIRVENARTVLDMCLSNSDVPYQVRLNAAIFILSTQDQDYLAKQKNIIETSNGISDALKSMVDACKKRAGEYKPQKIDDEGK